MIELFYYFHLTDSLLFTLLLNSLYPLLHLTKYETQEEFQMQQR